MSLCLLFFFSSSVAFLEAIEILFKLEVIATNNCSKEKKGPPDQNVIRTFVLFRSDKLISPNNRHSFKREKRSTESKCNVVVRTFVPFFFSSDKLVVCYKFVTFKCFSFFRLIVVLQRLLSFFFIYLKWSRPQLN